MWAWSLIFLVLAVIGGIFGLAGIATQAAFLGKAAFFLFLALFAITMLYSWQEARRGQL